MTIAEQPSIGLTEDLNANDENSDQTKTNAFLKLEVIDRDIDDPNSDEGENEDEDTVLTEVQRLNYPEMNRYINQKFFSRFL